MSSKAGQFLVALMCGMNDTHPIMKALLSEPGDMASDLMQGVKPAKADLLEPVGLGDTFFEHDAFWEHLPEILKTVAESGDPVTGEDLAGKIILNHKNALDYAIEKEKLQQIFAPEVWKGRLPAMEKAWFRVPERKRDVPAFNQLRTAIATAGGEELRENVLAQANVFVVSIRDGVRSGTCAELDKRLVAMGDHLRATDVLCPDKDGDHALDSLQAWTNFDRLLDVLEPHGEKFEVQHFLHKHYDRASPLEKAVGTGMAAKLFSFRVWRGRPQDMMALYEHVPKDKRSHIAIDTVLQEIEDDIFSSRVNIGPGLKKGDLTAIVNGATDGTNPAPVRGLGLKKVWNDISGVRELLQAGGDPLRLDDLRLPSGSNGETGLMTAARCGKFGDALDILAANGEELAVTDLTAPDKTGKRLADILTETTQVGLIARAELWAHRPEDFRQMWNALPDRGKDQVDYQDLVSEMDLIALRRRFAGPPPVPGLSP